MSERVPGCADDGGAQGDGNAHVGPAVRGHVVEELAPILILRHNYYTTFN